MASKQTVVEYIIDQLSLEGVTYKRLFGEYGIYHDGKIVALVCDNQLYVKPTDPGRALMSCLSQGSPYPGAKPHLLIDHNLDDSAWLTELFRVTSAALPQPKPKAIQGRSVRQSRATPSSARAKKPARASR